MCFRWIWAALLLFCLFQAEGFEDFERHSPGEAGSWRFRCDPRSQKPSGEIVSGDAAEGRQALRLTWPGSETYCGAAMRLPGIPAGSVALELFVKPLDDRYPRSILLEEMTGEREVFQAHLPELVPGKWRKVTIPLDEFRFVMARFGDEPQNRRLDFGVPVEFAITGYRQEFSEMFIDELRWLHGETKPAAANLIPGDTSFESGPGAWIPRNGAALPRHIADDGARGSHCLELTALPEVERFESVRIDLEKETPYTLSFYARADGESELNAMFFTREWRRPLNVRVTPGKEWKRYAFTFDRYDRASYGTVGFRVLRGSVRIDAVQFEKGRSATPFQPAEETGFYATTGADAEILTAGSPAELTVRVVNYSRDERSYELKFELGSRCETRRFSLAPEECSELAFPLPESRVPGYYPVKLTLNGETGYAAFAVVPEPHPFRPGEGFFGLHAGAVPYRALRRIGCSWIRASVMKWSEAESRRGRIQPIRKRDFGGVPMNQLGLTEVLIDVPGWAAGPHRTPEHPEWFAEYLHRAATAGLPETGFFELANEPDWMLLRHGNSAEQALELYVRALRAAAPVLRSAGAKLVHGSSGNGERFSEAVFRQAAESFDVYAPHPYVQPRYLGVGAIGCRSPEEGKIRERMLAAEKLLAAGGNRQELWVGELGWALDTAAAPDSKWAVRQAEYLSRAMLLCRTVPSLRRVIWFTCLGMLEGRNYEYGIFRNDNGIHPLPAAAAYAWCAAELEQARDCRLAYDGEFKLVGWKSESGNAFALWSADEEAEPLRISLPQGVSAFSMFGTPEPGVLEIGSSPVFLHGGNDALEAELIRHFDAGRPLNAAIRLAGVQEVAVTLRTGSSGGWSGELSLAGVSRRIRLAPGKEEEIRMPLAEKPGTEASPLRLDFTSDEGAQFALVRTLPGLHPIRRGLRLNREPDFILDRREFLLPPDPAVGWKGAQDHSVRLWLGWNDEGLLLHAEVADDDFEHPFDGEKIWKNDCIQFAIDTRNDARPGDRYSVDDYEYGCALDRDAKPVAWRWYAPPEKTRGDVSGALRFAVSNEGGKQLYRITVPWRELAPLRPGAGSVFGANVIVHDRDGGRAKSHMALAPGMVTGKSPAMFLKFYLTD